MMKTSKSKRLFTTETQRTQREFQKMYLDADLTRDIIGAAIEVHRELGPGLLESAYQTCLAHELGLRKIAFEREKPIHIEYKNYQLDCGYQLDFVVDNKVIVELKSVEVILPVHEAQILTYLKLTKCQVGLLINFNVAVLIKGVRRFVL